MPSSTVWWTEARPDLALPGWLAPTPNRGWVYHDRIGPADDGRLASVFYALRHPHTDRQGWLRRLREGEISRNGRPLPGDARLRRGDRLAWRRPAWIEAPVPADWGVIHDDGDLMVIDKPAGLPVLPAGGYLEHTLLRRLERLHAGDRGGVPRPVHRLGRFTSGLLVCARRPATRARLSEALRDSTRLAGAAATGGGDSPCRKDYLAWLWPHLDLEPGESREIRLPIGRVPHPLLGRVWAAAPCAPDALPAHSSLTLLEHGSEADLARVTIGSGRPHQIRIHCAALGAPLLGDPLYRPGGLARPEALPGEGGYRLHAWRLALPQPSAHPLELEAPPPWSAVAALEVDQP